MKVKPHPQVLPSSEMFTAARLFFFLPVFRQFFLFPCVEMKKRCFSVTSSPSNGDWLQVHRGAPILPESNINVVDKKKYNHEALA